MKSIITILLILVIAICQVNAENWKETFANRQIITSEMIQKAGLIWLGDIFMLAEDWDVITLDGITWQSSPSGLSSFQHQKWIILLDGQVMDIDVFGTRNLNRLPLSLSRIDYIEFVTIPQIHEGEFADGGLIHIHTLKPGTGLSISSQMITGSETGDPGPYRYTEFRSPNIDRFGHNFSTDFSYGDDKMYVQAGLWGGWRYPTDPDLSRRYFSYFNGDYSKLKHIAPSFKIGKDFHNGKHELFMGCSWFEDLFFLKPFGREIPVESHFLHTGTRGNFNLNDKTNMIYRITYSENQLVEQENLRNTGFDWRMRNMKAEIGANGLFSSCQFKVGLGLIKIFPKTTYELSNDNYTRGKLYGELFYSLKDDLHQRLGFNVITAENSLEYQAVLSNQWWANSKQAINVTFSYSSQPAEGTDDIWYWAEHGFNFLKDNGVDVNIDGEIGTMRRFTTDLTWMFNNNNNLSLQLVGYYRYLYDIYFESQPFQYDSSDQSFLSTVDVTTNHSGQIGGCKIAVELGFIPHLKCRFSYRFQDVIEGNTIFKNIWNSIPKHRIRNTIIYEPVNDFSLWAMLNYRSSTLWADYHDVESQSNGIYSADVKSAINLDIAIQKYLWQKRIRGNFVFRNLFNEKLRYHPLGASFDLSYLLQVEIRFDSI